MGQFKNSVRNENNINDCTISQTKSCKQYFFDKYVFIDTPGFNDTMGDSNDEKNFNAILRACKNADYIHGIILVLNGTNARLTVQTINLYENFKRFFPTKLIENVIIVLTNCDENSCNLNLSFLNDIVKYKSCYFMQNSFLHWNKQSLDTNSKRFRNLNSDWNESIETITLILKDISNFNSISTSTFEDIEKLTKNISINIREQLRNILNHFYFFDQLNLKKMAVEKSIENMNNNSSHKKSHEIEAMRFNSKELVKINVQLSDKRAIYQYNQSLIQLQRAQNCYKSLVGELIKIQNDFDAQISSLDSMVLQLKHECKGYNFVKEYGDILNEFKELSIIRPNLKFEINCILNIFGEDNFTDGASERYVCVF